MWSNGKPEKPKHYKVSNLAEKYNEPLDTKSAYELLTAKIEQAQKEDVQEKLRKQQEHVSQQKRSFWLFEWLNSPFAKQMGRTVAREVTRGILGVLGISKTMRRR